jgi:hypothetical protein
MSILNVIKQFDLLSNKLKVEVLLTALSYMQQYNGRTINECIVLSMGYEYDEEEGWLKIS